MICCFSRHFSNTLDLQGEIHHYAQPSGKHRPNAAILIQYTKLYYSCFLYYTAVYYTVYYAVN